MTPPEDDTDWRYAALVSAAAGFPVEVKDKEGDGALEADQARTGADRDCYRRPLFARALIFLNGLELSKKT